MHKHNPVSASLHAVCAAIEQVIGQNKWHLHGRTHENFASIFHRVVNVVHVHSSVFHDPL